MDIGHLKLLFWDELMQRSLYGGGKAGGCWRLRKWSTVERGRRSDGRDICTARGRRIGGKRSMVMGCTMLDMVKMSMLMMAVVRSPR